MFTFAIAVVGCGASLGSGPDAGAGGTGGAGGTAGTAGTGESGGTGGTGGYDAYPTGTFCDKPLEDDCSTLPLQTSTANICTLDGGIGFACLPCGQLSAGASCVLQSALIRGARYTYVQIVNVDVAFIYAYDQNQKLVAKLEWSANLLAGGQEPWSCSAGPAVFDSTEAKALLPAGATSSELLCAR